MLLDVNATSPLAAHVLPGRDVLAAVGGSPVGNDGTVAFRANGNGTEAINITYFISQLQVGPGGGGQRGKWAGASGQCWMGYMPYCISQLQARGRAAGATAGAGQATAADR